MIDGGAGAQPPGSEAAPSDLELVAAPWERGTMGVLFVLLFAIGLGATAGLLQGFHALPVPPHQFFPFNLLGWILAILGACLIACYLLYRLLRGERSAGLPVQGGIGLLAFAMTVVIVVAVLGLVVSQHSGGIGPVGGTNSTGGPGGPGGPGGGGNATGNGSLVGHSNATTPPIPPLVFGLAGGIVVALLAVPFAAFLLTRGRHREPAGPEVPPELIRALAGAAAALREGAVVGAREQIVEAYGILLGHLRAARMEGLEVSTPREIETRMETSLGLSSPSARELRSLFEEARYSPHVMTEAHRAEALQSLEAVLGELTTHRPDRGVVGVPRGNLPGGGVP